MSTGHRKCAFGLATMARATPWLIWSVCLASITRPPRTEAAPINPFDVSAQSVSASATYIASPSEVIIPPPLTSIPVGISVQEMLTVTSTTGFLQGGTVTAVLDLLVGGNTIELFRLAFVIDPAPATQLDVTFPLANAPELGPGNYGYQVTTSIVVNPGMTTSLTSPTFPLLVTTIPEPPGAVLMGVGCLGVLGVLWSRQSTRSGPCSPGARARASSSQRS